MISTRKPQPLTLAKRLWPDRYFYREQQEIFQSVWDNNETIVVAGNQLGKDFVAARIVLVYFLTHHPCRIVTTSATDRHMDVLWGEMGQAAQESAVPLLYGRGGCLIWNHRHIRRVYGNGISKLCYVKGMVAAKDTIAALQGHHARYTLFVADEASSIPDGYFQMANGWAKKKLIFGNPWPCNNYFYRAVEGEPGEDDPGGDIPV